MLHLQITKTDWTGTEHFLYVLVPIAVEKLVLWYINNEVQPQYDLLENEATQELLNHADVLLYVSPDNIKQANDIFNALVQAIAILAFIPYGVEIFGHRYEVLSGSKKA